jgi:hypothetical protein
VYSPWITAEGKKMSHVEHSAPLSRRHHRHHHGEHGKHALPQPDAEIMEEEPAEESTRNYGLIAFGTAFVLLLVLAVQGVFSVFIDLCPDASTASCSRVPLGSAFPALNIIALILAFILGAISTLSAVEAIARKEKQTLAYTALVSITFMILLFSSGIYHDFIQRIVLRIFY